MMRRFVGWSLFCKFLPSTFWEFPKSLSFCIVRCRFCRFRHAIMLHMTKHRSMWPAEVLERPQDVMLIFNFFQFHSLWVLKQATELNQEIRVRSLNSNKKKRPTDNRLTKKSVLRCSSDEWSVLPIQYHYQLNSLDFVCEKKLSWEKVFFAFVVVAVRIYKFSLFEIGRCGSCFTIQIQRIRFLVCKHSTIDLIPTGWQYKARINKQRVANPDGPQFVSHFS